jgi:plasmid stabilization system protein ParE
MKVRYRARALADLEEISRYLEPRSPVGARNVLGAIRDSVEQIAGDPFLAARTSDPALRVKVLGRYRYKIFYEVIDSDAVDITHIRHTARRPWL